MRDVHPVLQQTLDVARDVIDALRTAQESAGAHRSGVINEDGDIAVSVDSHATLRQLWLKPGVLDRKPPARIATEINHLLVQADTAAREHSQQLTDDAMRRVTALVAELPNESEYFPAAPAQGVDHRGT